MKGQVFVLSAAFVAQMMLRAGLVEDAERCQEAFWNVLELPCRTNANFCIWEVVRKEGRVQFETRMDDPSRLSRVRIFRADGGLTAYEYGRDGLDSSFVSGTNATEGVMTLYVGNRGRTNDVSRIEIRIARGKIASDSICYRGDGSAVAQPKESGNRFFDIEYIPPKGAYTMIGPYRWTIVGAHSEGILSRDGRILFRGAIGLGGKYPWLVGGCTEYGLQNGVRQELLNKGVEPHYGGKSASYCFLLDMRDDSIEYFSIQNAETNSVFKLMGEGGCPKHGFWYYALSKHANRNRKRLLDALKLSYEGSCEK